MQGFKNQNPPYKTGEDGYNRRSGKKTLVFVGICICLVVFLSIAAALDLFLK